MADLVADTDIVQSLNTPLTRPRRRLSCARLADDHTTDGEQPSTPSLDPPLLDPVRARARTPRVGSVSRRGAAAPRPRTRPERAGVGGARLEQRRSNVLLAGALFAFTLAASTTPRWARCARPTSRKSVERARGLRGKQACLRYPRARLRESGPRSRVPRQRLDLLALRAARACPASSGRSSDGVARPVARRDRRMCTTSPRRARSRARGVAQFVVCYCRVFKVQSCPPAFDRLEVEPPRRLQL